MKITFYTLTILFFSFLLAPHYSQGSNSKYPSDQRQESISIAAKESSDLPLIINEVAGFVGAYAAQDFGYSVAVFEDLAVVGDPYSDYGQKQIEVQLMYSGASPGAVVGYP